MSSEKKSNKSEKKSKIKEFFHHDSSADEVAKQVVDQPAKALRAQNKRELPKDAIKEHSKFDKFKGEK
jgi:hypothetical protein